MFGVWNAFPPALANGQVSATLPCRFATYLPAISAGYGAPFGEDVKWQRPAIHIGPNSTICLVQHVDTKDVAKHRVSFRLVVSSQPKYEDERELLAQSAQAMQPQDNTKQALLLTLAPAALTVAALLGAVAVAALA